MSELVKDKQNLPASIDLESMAGAGMESVGVKDMAIPFLKILQQLSPEINKKKPEYIEGAEVGRICNTVTKEISDAVSVVPCFYQFVVNEWKPNRGGYVATHQPGDPVVLKATPFVTADGKRIMRSAEGNDLVDTAQWYVLIQTKDLEWTWGVIAMTSTQLKHSRKLMTRLQSIKMEGKNGSFTPPIFAHVLTMSTAEESNNLGDYYNWKIEIDDKKTSQYSGLLQKAIEYNSQITAGLVKVTPPSEESSEEVPY